MQSLTARTLQLLLRFTPYLLLALAIDQWFVHQSLLVTGGELCPILDDAFIFFQYARGFAEGHPLSYNAGDAPTTGATSLLYTLLLSIGWLVGFRDGAIMLFAHGLAVVGLALSLVACKKLGDALVGPPGGLLAAILVVCTPRFTFLAVGGMEIAVASAAFLAAIAGAACWLTAWGSDKELTVRGAILLCLLGGLASLARPEAGAAACAVAVALVVAAPSGAQWTRLLAPLAVLPAFINTTVAWVTTGLWATNGQLLKFVPNVPGLTTEEQRTIITRNLRELWHLLTGSPSGPLAPGFVGIVVLSVVVVLLHFWRRFGPRRATPMALVLIGPLAAVLLPVLYLNLGALYRYVFLSLPLVFVVVACGLVIVGRAMTARSPLLRTAPYVLVLTLAGFHAHTYPQALGETVEASREISAQQVELARTIRELPPEAVIALNDAGALAFLGGRRTFDMMGLTTPHAVHDFWQGAGAMFEAWERLDVHQRPTHLAFYPSWFPTLATSPLSGPLLRAVEVEPARYLGAARAELRVIQTELFGTGEQPAAPPVGWTLADRLDVADRLSERAHSYACDLNRPRTTVIGASADGRADGGRPVHRGDRFLLRAEPGRAVRLVMRLGATEEVDVEIRFNDLLLGKFKLDGTKTWRELAIDVSPESVGETNVIERSASESGRLIAYHDWLYQK